MEKLDHELLECACGQRYVVSARRGTDWACPTCGEADDYDNLIPCAGPPRLLSDTEPLPLGGKVMDATWEEKQAREVLEVLPHVVYLTSQRFVCEAMTPEVGFALEQYASTLLWRQLSWTQGLLRIVSVFVTPEGRAVLDVWGMNEEGRKLASTLKRLSEKSDGKE